MMVEYKESHALTGKSKNQTRFRSGFTIVELLIVIVVIGILAAITIVAYNGITQKANKASAQAGANQAGQKAEIARAGSGTLYPVDKTALGVTDADTTYIQYGGGAGYCASTNKGGYSYYVSNIQTAPAQGECESAPMANGAATTVVCPSGFIPVPGDARFGTNDFCVMKYEAKNDGSSHPQSIAAGTPWVNITQTSAVTTSQVAVDQSDAPVSGAHLITEPEWMTIAANVLSVPDNWSGGAVGSGFIYSGHNDGSPNSPLAASTDDDGYSGTGNVSPSNQKRSLYLTNGSTIWDFAGNVYEWTNYTLSPQHIGLSSDSAYAWRQWNLGGLSFGNLPSTSLPGAINSTVAGWSNAQGIGQLYADYADTTTRAIRRGGDYAIPNQTGVLTLNLDDRPTDSDFNLGFRVTR